MILQPTANSRISMRQLIMPSSGFSTLLTTRHYKKPAYFQRAIGSDICEKTCGDLLRLLLNQRSCVASRHEGSNSIGALKSFSQGFSFVSEVIAKVHLSNNSPCYLVY